MTDLSIVMMRIDEVTPYPHNARSNEETVLALMKSIPKFGFNQPLVIDRQGVIVKGHARFEAAKRLGMVEVPCIVSQNSKSVNDADRLYDNKIAELSHWDEDSLNAELRDVGDIMDSILGATAVEYRIDKLDIGVTAEALAKAEVKRVRANDAGKEFVMAKCEHCGEELYFERGQLERLL